MMPPSESPIHAVQCPKCGSPVEGVAAGDVASCSYCGATLQVSAGASGHPVAKLANIEASTSYLARTEALKRLQRQLEESDEALEVLRASHRATQQETESAAKGMGGCYLWSGLLTVVAFLVDPYFGMAIAVTLTLVLIGTASGKKKRAAALAQETDALLQEGLAARAERDRLAQRIVQLEAGLDDLADHL